MSISQKSHVLGEEFDPLLKDLDEKKQSFKRNVVSLAAELNKVRGRLVLQEQSVAREILTRQEAEAKAKKMEEEINVLQKRLGEKNQELLTSTSSTEKYLGELDILKSLLASPQETAEASVASARSAQLQYFTLLKELDERNNSLKKYEDHAERLGKQLNNLQKDLQMREYSQKQLTDEVMRVERDIMQALDQAGLSKECDLKTVLDEISPKNIEKMIRLLIVKDEEVVKLRDEIRIMSGHWKYKSIELESQLEKQRRVDRELKKRILKLEFCLQENRSQMRKLQRMGEQRDKTVKELRDHLAVKQLQKSDSTSKEKQNFWETPGFKVVVSMSMLILVMISKR